MAPARHIAPSSTQWMTDKQELVREHWHFEDVAGFLNAANGSGAGPATQLQEDLVTQAKSIYCCCPPPPELPSLSVADSEDGSARCTSPELLLSQPHHLARFRHPWSPPPSLVVRQMFLPPPTGSSRPRTSSAKNRSRWSSANLGRRTSGRNRPTVFRPNWSQINRNVAPLRPRLRGSFVSQKVQLLKTST